MKKLTNGPLTFEGYDNLVVVVLCGQTYDVPKSALQSWLNTNEDGTFGYDEAMRRLSDGECVSVASGKSTGKPVMLDSIIIDGRVDSKLVFENGQGLSAIQNRTFRHPRQEPGRPNLPDGFTSTRHPGSWLLEWENQGCDESIQIYDNGSLAVNVTNVTPEILAFLVQMRGA